MSLLHALVMALNLLFILINLQATLHGLLIFLHFNSKLQLLYLVEFVSMSLCNKGIVITNCNQ